MTKRDPRKRDASGRWLAGQSANPRGRLPRVTESYYYQLMRDNTPDRDFVAIHQNLIRIAKGGEGISNADAMRATKIVLEYMVPPPAYLHEGALRQGGKMEINLVWDKSPQIEVVEGDDVVDGEVVEK